VFALITDVKEVISGTGLGDPILHAIIGLGTYLLVRAVAWRRAHACWWALAAVMVLQSANEVRDWWDFLVMGKDFGLVYQMWDMVKDGVWTVTVPLGLMLREVRQRVWHDRPRTGVRAPTELQPEIEGADHGKHEDEP
jgi:hypothetical protein